MGKAPETAAECVTLAADPKKMLALGLLLAALAWMREGEAEAVRRAAALASIQA